MSLLEQNTTSKKRVDDNDATKLETGNSNKYKVKTICYSAVYIKELVEKLQKIYYLILYKSYLEKKNLEASLNGPAL